MKNSDNLVLSVNNASLNNESLGITKYDLRRFNKDVMDDPVFYSYPIDEIAKYKPIDSDDAVEIIKGIPSPTFLGLERTTLNQKNEDAHRADKRARSGMQVYSRLSMDESLTEAVRLARNAYNENYIKKRNEAANEFKFSVFTSLFEIDAKEDRSVVLPNSNELERQKQAVRRTIAVIQQAQLLPDVYINNTVRPFFEYYLKVYEETSAAISSNRNRTIKNIKNINETLVKWVTIDASFSSIKRVIDLATDYDNKEKEYFRSIKLYLEAINSFIEDSGKSVEFTDGGDILISLPKNCTGRVYQLSSGERQLFVLLTHLAFNPDAKMADVLIIDEPELSLHLKWQEQFVDAISRVSPSTQLILATHSPAIIGEMRNKCVSLNKFPVFNKKRMHSSIRND